MRYQTLSQTENELRDIFTDIGKNTMRLNQTYLKIIKDRNNNVLLQSSQLGSFQEKLDKARNAATAASIQVEMQNKTALSYVSPIFLHKTEKEKRATAFVDPHFIKFPLAFSRPCWAAANSRWRICILR
jgi:hypothetical protein